MAARQILVVHENDLIRSQLEQSLAYNGSVVSISTAARGKKRLGKQPFGFVVIEGGEAGYKNLQRLYRLKGKVKNATLLVAPPSLLENHQENLRALSVAALASANGRRPEKTVSNPSEEICLKDFVERKLRDFVKNMKVSGVRNLYSILLAEVERPLISYILKETNNNQVQAARLLGMNRNTLRKKIKELKIASGKRSGRLHGLKRSTVA
jgi:DNA-binding protein Fis